MTKEEAGNDHGNDCSKQLLQRVAARFETLQLRS